MGRDDNNKEKKHMRTIANLESQIDFLATELTYLNDLLYNIGFSQGITTLKKTAEELFAEERFNIQERP